MALEIPGPGSWSPGCADDAGDSVEQGRPRKLVQVGVGSASRDDRNFPRCCPGVPGPGFFAGEVDIPTEFYKSHGRK